MSSLLEELRRNRLMTTPSEVAAFEAGLAAIAREPDDGLLPQLHLVLDDGCVHYEVMFGLVHFLESFHVETQLRALLAVLPQLAQQAPEWSRILHFRILNDDVARTCYRQMLAGVEGPSLASAREILWRIAGQEGEPLKGAAKSVLVGGWSSRVASSRWLPLEPWRPGKLGMISMREDHPRQEVLFFISDEIEDRDVQEMSAALEELRSARSWTIGPPEFVDEVQEPERFEVDEPIRTVGGRFQIFSALPP